MMPGYGETLIADGVAAEAMPFRFSTKYHDTETGFYNYGLRIYRSDLGRWLSKDPIGEDGGLNHYGMVGNDAIGRWDLLGLCCEGAVSDWKIIKVYECLDGQSDAEFLRSLAVPAAVAAGIIGVASNLPPTPGTGGKPDYPGLVEAIGGFAIDQIPSKVDWTDAVKALPEIVRHQYKLRKLRMAIATSVCVQAKWKKCESFLLVLTSENEKSGVYEHQTGQPPPPTSAAIEEAKRKAKETLFK